MALSTGGRCVPRWAVGVCFFVVLIAPFFPGAAAVALHAAGWPTGEDPSHGLGVIVYVLGALAMVAAWFPLGMALFLMQQGITRLRPLIVVLLGAMAGVVGLAVMVDALDPRPLAAPEAAYLLSGAIASGAAGMAGAMARRMRPPRDKAKA